MSILEHFRFLLRIFSFRVNLTEDRVECSKFSARSWMRKPVKSFPQPADSKTADLSQLKKASAIRNSRLLVAESDEENSQG